MARLRTDIVIRSEAAAWIARLRSEERGAADEVAFQTWLNEDARHRQAFDLVNTAWDLAGGALAGAEVKPEPRTARRDGMSRRAVLIAATTALAAGVAAVYWRMSTPKGEMFHTAVGEQRRVSLPDGSVMLLDTTTSAKVILTAHRRAIELIGGRAHFEVAKCENRPFEVSFGDRKVVAVGTVFDVSRDGQTASILLTQGKVLVEAPAGRALMSPGDRVLFRQDQMTSDRPAIDTLTAWHAGRVVFENETLAEAVAELNRYNRRPLVIADASVSALRISGVYQADDAAGFAVSVSTLLPVAVDMRPDRVVLSPRPSAEGNGQPTSRLSDRQ